MAIGICAIVTAQLAVNWLASVALLCGGGLMGDWKSERDALVTETIELAKSVNVEIEWQRAQPKEVVERIRIDALDYRGCERGEIKKRVESFKAQQKRVAREEYAASLLRRIKSITKP